MPAEDKTNGGAVTADGGAGEGSEKIPRSDHSVPIHSLIESSQSAHGLRHSDYAQYRSYCSRRLSRLRHAKDVRKELSHGGKSGGQQKRGGRHAYQPRAFDPEESNRHVNYVLVSLYQAERAWSQSMEIKALYDAAREEAKKSSSSRPKKKKIGGGTAVDLGDKKRSAPSKIRSHQLRRLRRAASFASELEGLAAASCDGPSALEARAYASWMRGNLALETGDWAAGAREYGAAIRLCGELEEASDGVEKREELERRDYFHARAEHVIEPLLRYCRYEMQEGGMDQSDILALKDAEQSLQLKSKLDALRAERLRTQASGGGMSTVSFRGRDVPVENEALRVALLEAADLKAELKKNSSQEGSEEGGNNDNNDSDTKFLSLLSGYDVAAAVASEDLSEYEGMKAGPAVNARRRDAELLVGYVKYQKLRLLMRRNERMVDELREKERAAKKVCSGDRTDDIKRAEEIAHLYDALLQDARAVAALPGGGQGGNNGDDGAVGGDEEDEFALEADADVLRIRALRSYYVARLYASPSVGKHAEAAALLRLSKSLSARAAEEIAACQDMEDGGSRAEAMDELGGAIEAETCRAAAGAFLAKTRAGAQSHPSSRSVVGGGSGFLRRLDDFDASASCGDPPACLVDAPPLPEPIPCRPTFFDVALNHLGEFPLDDLTTHVGTHRQKKGGGGLLGWFSRG
mmetsp:Transcript_56477/g.168979  ORF Transcript_56477/g.168979 Transcript_56477/m.168979 type:complete len:691 (-) Transcript_56477:179-2251(-)|eukprot:CAMPEP_0113549024 /NCGR_PEP_ID=MMETSP0015_2-20120614/13211_1 /TAXON_ID=2838 /ORGANISM="Odontella" /LENGTH=690 /DNA_ID=CAMNT_0000449703 /DNA_START=279 /DNA_END=2351 /DNA_ORIENTATION=- /assembly_acc=CAM_ASM_000160